MPVTEMVRCLAARPRCICAMLVGTRTTLPPRGWRGLRMIHTSIVNPKDTAVNPMQSRAVAAVDRMIRSRSTIDPTQPQFTYVR